MKDNGFVDYKGYEGRYAVSPSGQVYSYWRKKIMSPADNGNGYLVLCLTDDNGKKKAKRVHLMVAETFIPKPDWWQEGMPIDVDHKDSNRKNNEVSNLCWKTRRENLDSEHYREAQKNKIYSEVRCVETGEIYPSIAAAGRAIGIHRYGINLCLLGKQHTAGGFHWERVREDEK